MNDLGNDARALIELARDAHDPGDDDRARVRARLASRLGVAAGLGVVAGLGVAAKTTATVGAGAGMAAGTGAGAGITAGTLGAGAAALKLIGAVLVVSATVGAGAVVVRHARRAPVAPVAVAEKAAPSSPRRSATGAAAVGAPTAREAARPEESLPASDPPRQSAKVHSSFTVAGAAQKPAQAPAQNPAQAHAMGPTPQNGLADPESGRADLAARRSAPAVADEASLFHDGIVALRSGQPDRALELFELHAHLYPHGVLAEERQAERALALADLGRTDEARAAIDHFLQKHPTSPLAARLLARAHLLDGADSKAGSGDEPGRAITPRHAP